MGNARRATAHREARRGRAITTANRSRPGTLVPAATRDTSRARSRSQPCACALMTRVQAGGSSRELRQACLKTLRTVTRNKPSGYGSSLDSLMAVCSKRRNILMRTFGPIVFNQCWKECRKHISKNPKRQIEHRYLKIAIVTSEFDLNSLGTDFRGIVAPARINPKIWLRLKRASMDFLKS